MKIKEVGGRFYIVNPDGSSYTEQSKIADEQVLKSFGSKELAESKIKELKDSQKSS